MSTCPGRMLWFGILGAMVAWLSWKISPFVYRKKQFPLKIFRGEFPFGEVENIHSLKLTANAPEHGLKPQKERSNHPFSGAKPLVSGVDLKTLKIVEDLMKPKTIFRDFGWLDSVGIL